MQKKDGFDGVGRGCSPVNEPPEGIPKKWEETYKKRLEMLSNSKL
jgi:hypothetical protein